jgi:hypothetical protein
VYERITRFLLWYFLFLSYQEPLRISISKIFLPSETFLQVNFVTNLTSFCVESLNSTKLYCQTQHLFNSSITSKEPLTPSNFNQSFITCGNILPKTREQIIQLFWRYDFLNETITTTENFTQLPFLNLKFSHKKENNSNLQSIFIETNQNLTDYKKTKNDVLYCFLGVGKYSVGEILKGEENILTCNVTFEKNGELKNVTIVDDSKNFLLSEEFLLFLIHRKNFVSRIYPETVVEVSDVFVVFENSTLEENVVGVVYYCLVRDKVFVGQVMNATIVKCLNVGFNETFYGEISVFAYLDAPHVKINTNQVGITFIRLNSCFLIFFSGKQTLEYGLQTSRIGFINALNKFTFSFKNFTTSRVWLRLQESFIKPEELTNNYKVDLVSPIRGEMNLSAYFESENSYYFKGIPGAFQKEIKLNITNLTNLNVGDYGNFTLNTEILIKKNLMNGNCFDLKLFYERTELKTNIINCNTENTTVYFELLPNGGKTAGYSVFHGNSLVNSSSTFSFNNTSKSFSKIEKIETKEELAILSSNFLTFIFVGEENFTSNSRGTIQNSTIVEISSPFDYGNRITLQLKYNNNTFDATNLNNQLFRFTIESFEEQLVEIVTFIIHMDTNESLLISKSSIPFHFVSKKENLTHIQEQVQILHTFPFLDTFSSQEKTISPTFYVDVTLKSDFFLFCKFEFKNQTRYSNATFSSQNSHLTCNVTITNLTLNNEIIIFQLVLNTKQDSFVGVSNNVSYLFMRGNEVF